MFRLRRRASLARCAAAVMALLGAAAMPLGGASAGGALAHGGRVCGGAWGDLAAELARPRAECGRLSLRGGAVRELPREAPATKKEGGTGGKRKVPNNPTRWRLFVANLPQGLNDVGLLEAFEPFGDVEEARVMRDIETGQSRRMAYVSFKTEEQRDEALEEMHKTKICAPATSNGPPVCTKIEVHEAKPPQQTW